MSQSIWLLAASADHLEFVLVGRQILYEYVCSGRCSQTCLSATSFGGILSLQYPCEAVDGSLVSELLSVLFFDYSFINIC